MENRLFTIPKSQGDRRDEAEPKAMSKTELALMYFPASQPKTALNHLMSWIKRCRPLMEKLLETGYRTQDKWLTPRQVEAVMYYLGEP